MIELPDHYRRMIEQHGAGETVRLLAEAIAALVAAAQAANLDLSKCQGLGHLDEWRLNRARETLQEAIAKARGVDAKS